MRVVMGGCGGGVVMGGGGDDVRAVMGGVVEG